MGKFSEAIQPHHTTFIQQQHLFFVASAPLANDTHINVSPKGLDSFAIISDTQVAYMDIIGSGNETAAHLHDNGRITFMFCSFDKVPNILRLYGKGKVVKNTDKDWEQYGKHFTIYQSTRQIIVADIHLVQTSCGYGIPFYEYKGERDTHFAWAEKKQAEGLKQYIEEKNQVSIDGIKCYPSD